METKKKCCIKVIKGNFYIYSWQYRPKSERTPRKNQRYFWKYQGKYSRQNEYINTLTTSERYMAELEYKEKKRKERKIKKLITNLENREPFKSQKDEIMKTKNRINRDNAYRDFKKKLRKIAKRKLVHIYQ